MKRFYLSIVVSLAFSCAGCSASSVWSQEGLIGGIAGTAVGGGIGAALAEEFGHRTENVLINGAIGAGTGLLAGAAINEINTERAHKKARVVRQAKMIGETQREIDLLRQEMHDSSAWGRSEVKTWNERYWGTSHNRPYQGQAPK